MTSKRISFRVPKALRQRLRHPSRLHGKTESEVVRDALEVYLRRSDEVRAAYELAHEADIVGCMRQEPRELSSNHHHLEKFRCQRATRSGRRRAPKRAPER